MTDTEFGAVGTEYNETLRAQEFTPAREYGAAEEQRGERKKKRSSARQRALMQATAAVMAAVVAVSAAAGSAAEVIDFPQPEGFTQEYRVHLIGMMDAFRREDEMEIFEYSLSPLTNQLLEDVWWPYQDALEGAGYSTNVSFNGDRWGDFTTGERLKPWTIGHNGDKDNWHSTMFYNFSDGETEWSRDSTLYHWDGVWNDNFTFVYNSHESAIGSDIQTGVEKWYGDGASPATLPTSIQSGTWEFYTSARDGMRRRGLIDGTVQYNVENLSSPVLTFQNGYLVSGGSPFEIREDDPGLIWCEERPVADIEFPDDPYFHPQPIHVS